MKQVASSLPPSSPPPPSTPPSHAQELFELDRRADDVDLNVPRTPEPHSDDASADPFGFFSAERSLKSKLPGGVAMNLYVSTPRAMRRLEVHVGSEAGGSSLSSTPKKIKDSKKNKGKGKGKDKERTAKPPLSSSSTAKTPRSRRTGTGAGATARTPVRDMFSTPPKSSPQLLPSRRRSTRTSCVRGARPKEDADALPLVEEELPESDEELPGMRVTRSSTRRFVSKPVSTTSSGTGRRVTRGAENDTPATSISAYVPGSGAAKGKDKGKGKHQISSSVKSRGKRAREESDDDDDDDAMELVEPSSEDYSPTKRRRVDRSTRGTPKATAQYKRQSSKNSTASKRKARAPKPLGDHLELDSDDREKWETERRARIEYFKNLEEYEVAEESVYII